MPKWVTKYTLADVNIPVRPARVKSMSGKTQCVFEREREIESE